MTFVRDSTTLQYTLGVITTLLNDAISRGHFSSYTIAVAHDDAHDEPGERALVHVAIFRGGVEAGSVILDDLDNPKTYPTGTARQRERSCEDLTLSLESLWTRPNSAPRA